MGCSGATEDRQPVTDRTGYDSGSAWRSISVDPQFHVPGIP